MSEDKHYAVPCIADMEEGPFPQPMYGCNDKGKPVRPQPSERRDRRARADAPRGRSSRHSRSTSLARG
jgi:hypothetical protein